LEWIEKGREIQSALENGAFPLVLGGDHSIALASLSAVQRFCESHKKTLIVVWLDAHGDANDTVSSPTGNIHGMPLACLLGRGDSDLIQAMDMSAFLDPKHVHQLGLRAVDKRERLIIQELGYHTYSMHDFDQQGIWTIMESILNPLKGRGDVHIHLSFDVDFMDPQNAPGVGTPAWGGPTLREVRMLFESLYASQSLGSMDIVEYNPTLDPDGITMGYLIKLVPFLFGKTLL
jgi:arginase